MNKADKERIKTSFQDRIDMLTKYAGSCALDKIGINNEIEFFDDEIEKAFWDIISLKELMRDILGGKE